MTQSIQELFSDAEGTSRELTLILVNQYLDKAEVAIVKVREAATTVANYERIFGANARKEFKIMDDMLEELCAQLRPQYSRYKYICDFFYECPRQAMPCLQALTEKINTLKALKEKLEAGGRRRK
jgi:hypothetical protein